MFKAHSGVPRVSKSLRHRPAGVQIWFGAGGHAGSHLPLVNMQQVQQGCGVLLSSKTQPFWGQRVGDRRQPRALSRPGGERGPRSRSVFCRAEVEEPSCCGGALWVWETVSRSPLRAVVQFNSFTDFLCLSSRRLGLADFAKSTVKVSIHHAVDVPLEIIQDDAPRVLLHLHSYGTVCSVLHGQLRLTWWLNKDDQWVRPYIYRRIKTDDVHVLKQPSKWL